MSEVYKRIINHVEYIEMGLMFTNLAIVGEPRIVAVVIEHDWTIKNGGSPSNTAKNGVVLMIIDNIYIYIHCHFVGN